MSILWDVGSFTKIVEVPMSIITTGTQNMGNGVYWLKAGTPISEAGAVKNDGDAKYLVAEDFYFYSNTPAQPKLVKLIETGYVDLNKAEKAAGITFESTAVSALAEAGIFLVNGALTGANVGVPSPMENQADSTATSVANLKSDFNDLLTKLKTVGLMEADEIVDSEPAV